MCVCVLQGTLEQVTELLAQVVARPYLRKPRTEIIRITRECREKRMWLIKDCKTLPLVYPPMFYNSMSGNSILHISMSHTAGGPLH